jgi:hypothetical protein
LSLVDAQGNRAIQPGDYQVFVGGKQPESGEQGLPLRITGTKALPE